MDLKHIDIKGKKGTSLSESEWVSTDGFHLLHCCTLLTHREGGQIQSINEIPVQNYFFQMMSYLKEEKWHLFYMFYGMRYSR